MVTYYSWYCYFRRDVTRMAELYMWAHVRFVLYVRRYGGHLIKHEYGYEYNTR